MKNLNLFIPITKVDEEKRIVYGIATAEQPDHSGEICDYATTVPYYKAWSDRMDKASDGKSKGNLRSMHENKAAGKITHIEFNDVEKCIEIAAKVVDDDEWNKVTEGVYTGFSQGGRYVKTWKDGDYTRYTAEPSEVSLVDNPCLPSATFTMLRSDGATELRKFKVKEDDNQQSEDPVLPIQVWQASDGTTYLTKAEAATRNAQVKVEGITKESLTKIAEIEGELEKKENTGEQEETVPAATKPDLVKYMGGEVWDASMAIDALCAVQMLFQCEASEEENEAGQLADLQQVIDRLKSFISSEIMEGSEAGNKMEMAAKSELEKRYTEASDKIDHLQNENKALQDTVAKMNSSLEKILERLKRVEAQPAPAKGSLYRVEKGHEVSASGKPGETAISHRTASLRDIYK